MPRDIWPPIAEVSRSFSSQLPALDAAGDEISDATVQPETSTCYYCAAKGKIED